MRSSLRSVFKKESIMKSSILLSLSLFSALTGCAAIVPMESKEISDQVKRFEKPHENMSGIVLYRADSLGGDFWKKSLWIDGECIGKSAKGIFFYHEVEGDKEHKITTEVDFLTTYDLFLTTETGKLYFIEQYITSGPFPVGSRLGEKSESEGKREVSKLGLAKIGTCG